MDAAAAIVVDATDLFGVVERVWWVALRVGAMLMLAPMVGTRMLPMRVRLILTLALSVTLAPLLPAAPPIAVDAATFLGMARELAIGAAIGFIFRLGFEAAAFAGELISQGMGLSFAQMLDPLRGTQSPVMGQWFTILAGLSFFVVDGHLALVRVVFESYHLSTSGAAFSVAHLLEAVPAFAQSMLAAGVSLALPVVIAMLVVNIAFGVLARTAPALNPIAIGLPAALLIGFVLLLALLPRLHAPLEGWLNTTSAAAAAAVR